MGTPLDLIPHRAPWIVLDRLVALDDARAVAEKRVVAGDPLVGEGGLAGLFVVELAAQAAACLNGAKNLGRSGHLGYLVAARGWKFPRTITPGETLVIEVTRRAELGALASFRAVARVDDEEVASGELTCAARFDEEPAT